MRFSYGFPVMTCPIEPAFVSGEALATLGADAESAGFGSAWLTEHPAPPESWRQAGGHDAFDPFVALGFVAAATRELRLLTCLTVLSYRNPFLLARTAATLDALSGGRLDLGVGTGYLKGEFRALGVDFDRRNDLFDEALTVLKQAWTGEPVVHEGAGFSARGTTIRPVPAQRPHPPLWLGGNSKLTRRRVAESAQGWMPMPTTAEASKVLRSPVLESLEDLAGQLAYLRDHAEAVGRTEPIDVLYLLPDLDGADDEAGLRRHRELVPQLAEMGVTWCSVGGAGGGLDGARRFITRYGEDVIGRT